MQPILVLLWQIRNWVVCSEIWSVYKLLKIHDDTKKNGTCYQNAKKAACQITANGGTAKTWHYNRNFLYFASHAFFSCCRVVLQEL